MAKKTYQVVGPLTTFGAKPGEMFTRELDPQQEQRLLARGAIKVTTTKKKEEHEDG